MTIVAVVLYVLGMVMTAPTDAVQKETSRSFVLVVLLTWPLMAAIGLCLLPFMWFDRRGK